ncbi:restriction endonuclease subunit S [Agrobacterium leguminum]|uniref:restriction endonuclease subunit S n=1 Tax=Agrobacterium leguminum TaxID=2792015 RepID=UPI001F15D118|nr:restriction endonuclease subunit S [Agrobacterium leguminum]
MTISAKRGFMLQSEKYSRDMAGQSAERYILLKRGEFAYNKGNSQTAPQGCIFKLDVDSAVIPFVYYCFSLANDIDAGYAAHAFQNGVLNRELARAINSGVRNDGLLNLPAEDFFRCQIAVPPLLEQRAIAEVMDALEATIAQTDALVAALVDAKYATMRELLTRGIRREKAPMKPLPTRWILGRVAESVTHIPADWELVTLAKVAKLESGHTPSRDKAEYWNGEISWLSLADTEALDALEVDQTAECVTPKGIENSSARILPKDTVVFSRTATVGKASRMKRPMATSQDFANWVCGPTLVPAYLVQVFRHMEREWDRLQEGSTHQTIYMPVFKKLQILLPSATEQQKIADVGEAFDMRIAKERETRKVLAQNRDALAQELLSGRIRLPESIIGRHRNKAGQAA